MGRRQRVWAKAKRDALLLALGGRCAWCGRSLSLQFDCIVPQGPAHHGMDWSRRIAFYRAQAAIGNLQLLCCACHHCKTQRDRVARLS